MDKYTLQKKLPPCQVTRKLVSQIENFLNVQIPKLFQKELASMSGMFQGQNSGSLRKYALYIQEGGQTKELKKIDDFKGSTFPAKVRGLSMHLKLGIPEVMNISINFPRDQFAEVDLTVTDPKAKAKAQKIYDALRQILSAYARKRAIVHNPVFKVLLTLLVPVSLIGVGMWWKTDPMFMFLSLGWLVLLSVFLNYSLTQTFPYTTFETGKRFGLRGSLYFLLTLLAVTMISGYAYLVVIGMQERILP